MCFVGIWTNQIKCELVSGGPDHPIDSVKDFLKHRNIRPIWLHGDTLVDLFKHPMRKGSPLDLIWKRAQTMGLNQSIVKFADHQKHIKSAIRGEEAFFSDRHPLKLFRSISCNKRKDLGESDRFPWIARNNYNTAGSSFLMNKNVDEHKSKKVDRV